MNIHQWFDPLLSNLKTLEIDGILVWILFMVGLWHVWLGRNEARFRNTIPIIYSNWHWIIAMIQTLLTNPLNPEL